MTWLFQQQRDASSHIDSLSLTQELSVAILHEGTDGQLKCFSFWKVKHE